MASTSPNPSLHRLSDAAKSQQSVPSLQTQPPQQNPPHQPQQNPNSQPQCQINLPHPQHITQMQCYIHHFYDVNMQNLAAGHGGNANAISQLEQVQAREMAIQKATRLFKLQQ